MLFTAWSASWSTELQIWTDQIFAVEATSRETFSTCSMSGYIYYYLLSWQTHCFHKPSVKDFLNWLQVKIGDKPLKAFRIRGPQTPEIFVIWQLATLYQANWINMSANCVVALMWAHSWDSRQFQPIWCGCRPNLTKHGKGGYCADAQGRWGYSHLQH